MKYTEGISVKSVASEAQLNCKGYSTSSTWLMPSVDQITAYKLSRKQNETNAEDNFEIGRNVSKLIVSRNI